MMSSFVVGTDEAVIVEVLGNRTSSQRIAIAEAYKASYGEVSQLLVEEAFSIYTNKR